jgi:hypothetical protein
MKKLILVAALTAIGVGAYAQGTVVFSNRASFVGGTTAENAITKKEDGTRLSGTDWVAQLYWAPGAGAAEGSLQAVGSPVPFATGGAAGFLATSPTVTLPGAAVGSTVTVQVRAWNVAAGATFEAASGNFALPGVVGKSALITVSGLGGPNPPGPDILPANITGLRGFQVVPVPEPSVIALGLVGAGLLFLRRRK